MPRAKKAAMRMTAEETEEVALHPKRSARKRKAVNYAEPKEQDPDWTDEQPKKKSIKKSKTVQTVAVEATEGVPAEASGQVNAPIELDDSPSPPSVPQPKPKPKKRTRKARDDEIEFNDDGEEIRKREYLSDPPNDFGGRKHRALLQPIAVVCRERYDSEDYPQEKFTMMGSVGKEYQVDIKLVPKCTCPDFTFRRQSCKHIIYVLHYALKVPVNSELLYQQAFTSSELKQILNEETTAPAVSPEDLYRDGKRKLIEGECPICYMEFDLNKEAIDYCKAACGNNVHATCMRLWIQSQRGSYGKATCPYCRNAWIN